MPCINRPTTAECPTSGRRGHVRQVVERPFGVARVCLLERLELGQRGGSDEQGGAAHVGLLQGHAGAQAAQAFHRGLGRGVQLLVEASGW